MKKFSLFLIFILLFGGIGMTNAQEKPALLATSAYNPPAQMPLRLSPEMQQKVIKNATVAISTAKRAKAYLTPGKVWLWTEPTGEKVIKAALLYEGIVVTVIHFNPLNGSLLPCGLHSAVFEVKNPQIESVKSTLPKIVSKIQVLDGAEFREPENAWAIPLAYDGMIIGHLKVYSDGTHIVPDYPANQEMNAYGK